MGGLCSSSQQKVTNGTMRGLGGELNSCGAVKAVIVAFDYEGYTDIGSLTSTPDGTRFAKLCEACGAEVFPYYDKEIGNRVGFPDKDQVKAKMSECGRQLGPGDAFLFFYAGHGAQSEDPGGAEEDDGKDEEMCFVKQDGTYYPLKDNEVAQILLDDFNPETHCLFVTDCCHSGTLCDLNRAEFGDRPICHIGACADKDEGTDLGDGAALTTSLLETVEHFVADGMTEFSVTDVYNTAYEKFHQSALTEGFPPENYDFSFEKTPDMDPDTFPWPLVPPEGWHVDTMMDDEYQ